MQPTPPAGMIRIGITLTPEYRQDISGAVAHLVDAAARAESEGARLLLFPEGYLQGYLLEEEALRDAAFNLSSHGFGTLLARFPTSGPVIVLGLIEEDAGRYFNTAIVVQAGRLIGRYRKRHLLASERAFCPGTDCPVFEVDGLRFGISICYDTNFPDTARDVAEAGATLILCCANNMMPRARAETWRNLHNAIRGDRCRETGLWLASSDVTGERDGMVSWGPGAILTPAGEVAAQLPPDRAGLLTFDIPVS